MQKHIPFLFFPLSFIFGNWPQYHGPKFDKSTLSSATLTERINLSGKTLWKCPTPLGFSSFSTNSNIIFTLIAEEDEDGLLREVCIALNPNTGNKIWSTQLGIAAYGHKGGNAGTYNNSGGDGPRSTPSVNNKRVYIYDSSMTLHCLSADSGKSIWAVDIIDKHQGKNIMWKNASCPLLLENLVIICGGGKGQSFIGFDQETGEVRWKCGDAVPTHATPAFARIDDQDQVIFLCRSGLISINPENGQELWNQAFPFKVSTAASPVVAGHLVYCSAGYGVGAAVFKITRKQNSWKSETLWRKSNELMNHWSTPLYYQGNLYGIFGFKEYGDAPLQCVDLATGKIRWSKEGFGPGNLIRTGNQLIVLSDDGQVVVVYASPDAYKELGRKKLVDGKCWSTPILSNNLLIDRSTKEAAALLINDQNY